MQKQVEETGIFQLLSTGLLLQFYTYNKNQSNQYPSTSFFFKQLIVILTVGVLFR